MFSMVNNCKINYDIIKEKELKKLLNFKSVDIDFSSHQRYWENIKQENNSIIIAIIIIIFKLL